MSHQLRTPLMALQLRLNEIHDAPDLEAARTETAAAQVQAERPERTIAELLSMARDERRAAGRLLDAAVLAKLHADAWRPVFARAGGHLECAITPGLRVRATPGAIGQAVDVLLENALEQR